MTLFWTFVARARPRLFLTISFYLRQCDAVAIAILIADDDGTALYIVYIYIYMHGILMQLSEWETGLVYCFMHLIHKNRDFQKSPHLVVCYGAISSHIISMIRQYSGTGYWVLVLLLVLCSRPTWRKLFNLIAGDLLRDTREWNPLAFFPFHIPFRSVGTYSGRVWTAPWNMYVNLPANCVTRVINRFHDQQNFCHGLVLAPLAKICRSVDLFILSVFRVEICYNLMFDNVWKITSWKLEHL